MNRKQRAESLRGRQEVRRVPAHGLEVREVNGAPTLNGWASVTEHQYQVGPFTETIKRGAFTKTLSERPDVVLLVGHEGLPLARTTSGSLLLAEDDRGLHVDATLEPDDPDVQRLLPKVRRGDVSEMSFAFRVTRQTWDDDYEERMIHEVNLDRGDVSVVTMGANPATSFSMRDAREFLAQLNAPEFDEFVRSLESDRAGKYNLDTMKMRLYVEQQRAPKKTHDLELYKARAYALGLKAKHLR